MKIPEDVREEAMLTSKDMTIDQPTREKNILEPDTNEAEGNRKEAKKNQLHTRTSELH